MTKERRPLDDIVEEFESDLIKFSSENSISAVEMVGILDMMKHRIFHNLSKPAGHSFIIGEN